MAPPEVAETEASDLEKHTVRGDIAAGAEPGDCSVTTTTSVCDGQQPLSTTEDNDQVGVCMCMCICICTSCSMKNTF